MNAARQFAVWCGAGLCFGLVFASSASAVALAEPMFGVSGAGAAGVLARALERRQATAMADWRAAAIAFMLAAESFRRKPSIRRVTLLHETIENLARREQALVHTGVAPPNLIGDERSLSLLRTVRGVD